MKFLLSWHNMTWITWNHFEYLTLFYSFRPPEGCLQWHTGASGKLKSFNGGHSGTQQMIKNQNYDICIRTEMGKYLVASLWIEK